MALVIASRVKEITLTTGTGAYATAGVPNSSFKTFSARCAVGDNFYAMVEAVDSNGLPTGDWEEGYYTYSAANTISRTEIHSSSNSDGPVNWGAGVKHVYIALTARMMRGLFNGSVGQGGGSVPAPTPTPTPAPSGVRPVGPNSALFGEIIFQDEFNGTALDTNKWNDVIWYRPPEHVNAPRNYVVQNGSLHIYPLADNNGQFQYRTIDTDGKFQFMYGFMEARMKLCRGLGTWPAFWGYGHPGSDRPELDVMEAYPGGANDWGSGAPNYIPHDASCAIHNPDESLSYDRKVRQDFPQMDLSQDYHTYGAHWDSTGVQFYFDGQPWGPRANVTSLTGYQQYVLLDLWYGGVSGTPNASDTPQGIGNSFSIDYVRVWPLASGGSSSPVPSPSATIIDYYGDSTVWGYKSSVGTQVTTTVPEQVQGAFPTYIVNNMGFNSVSAKEMCENSGDMTAFGVGGWEDLMSGRSASHVLFNFCLNDVYEGRSVGDYTYYVNLMVTLAKQYGRKPIIVTPNPVGNANIAAHVQAMKDVATATGTAVIDVYAWALGYMASNAITQAAFTPDGTHPSDAMYIAIGNYVASQLPSKL